MSLLSAGLIHAVLDVLCMFWWLKGEGGDILKMKGSSCLVTRWHWSRCGCLGNPSPRWLPPSCQLSGYSRRRQLIWPDVKRKHKVNSGAEVHSLEAFRSFFMTCLLLDSCCHARKGQISECFRISEVKFTEFLDNSNSLFLLKCYLTQSNRLQCPKINQTVSCSHWVKERQWQTPMNARVTVRWYVHLVTGVTVCVSTLAPQVVTGTSAHVQGLGHTLQSSCTLQVPCEVKILLDSCLFIRSCFSGDENNHRKEALLSHCQFSEYWWICAPHLCGSALYEELSCRSHLSWSQNTSCARKSQILVETSSGVLSQQIFATASFPFLLRSLQGTEYFQREKQLMNGEQPFNPHWNPFWSMFRHEAVQSGWSYFTCPQTTYHLMYTLDLHFTSMDRASAQCIICGI